MECLSACVSFSLDEGSLGLYRFGVPQQGGGLVDSSFFLRCFGRNCPRYKYPYPSVSHVL